MTKSIELDTEVRDLLISRRGTWRKIARDSGVSFGWLSKFANGHIKNPGIVTLRLVRLAMRNPSRKART